MILAVLLLVAQAGAACGTVDDCRQQALTAADQGDYETFHDLAWRAVQKGRPNDPALMYLLARAMSLSGRPGDALVMLGRLADMGVKPNVAGDDFRRVRALKAWPELEARLAAMPEPTAAAPPPLRPSAPAPKAEPPAPLDVAPPVAAADNEALVVAPPGAPFEFEAPAFEPAGLAYDEVSKRFLLGDRRAARLMVVDENSHHVTPLVGATAAGFFDTLTGFAVDHRRGDLWVVSAQGDGEAAESIVHKLQLVSGRVLLQVPSEPGVRLVDVAVAPDGTVYAVDTLGGRLFRVRPGARSLESVAPLGDRPLSVALSGDRVAYVGSQRGIVRVDLASGAITPVTPPGTLGRVEVLRTHGRELLVVVTGAGNGASARLVRLVLDSSGRAVTRVQPLDSSVPDATAATVAGNMLYYVSGRGAIRAIRLK